MTHQVSKTTSYHSSRFLRIDSPDCSEDDVCRDEIDVELVGSGQNRWQTNVFAPSEADEDPHYGRFSQTMEFDSNPSITSLHNYTIEWDSEQITWYVDGQMSAGKSRRTLSKGTVRFSFSCA